MNANRKLNAIGYAWLTQQYRLDPIPHFVKSFTSKPGIRLTEHEGTQKKEIYPHTVYRLDSVLEHLDFALKHEGLHLELIRNLMPMLESDTVVAYVRATPTGANARRIAYLYEAFSGRKLPLPDIRMGNYVPLADPQKYFTGTVIKQPRWRIDFNLLHSLDCSFMLRKTPALKPGRDDAMHQHCAELVADLPAEIFQRAVRYLYAKETRTSYAIEHETPSQQRADRFIALLSRAGNDDILTEGGLTRLQNEVVDPRFVATGWRDFQNYVGRTLAPGIEDIHLVPPRPEDMAFLMQAWLETARHLAKSTEVPPVAAAALVAWSFVYLHPFEDGNGRIHRFLIHHILAARHFGPPEVLLPVSAVLLNRPADYDASLEAFSVPLKSRTNYSLGADGTLVVHQATIDHFRYIDFTAMAEALYGFLEETIEKEIPAELQFLKSYEAARVAMRDVVDLPEPTANLFLRLCLQNNGRLSKAKRSLNSFEKLHDDEILRLEQAVSEAYQLTIS